MGKKGKRVSFNEKFRRLLVQWTYHNDMELINSPHRKSMDFFILQVIFGTAFGILTGGTYMSGFAIYMGASDELVSYIPIIGSISGIFLIFAGTFLERFSNRRKLVIAFNFIIKPMLVSTIFIPLIIPKTMRVASLFVILLAAYTLNSLMGMAINSWFVKVIPIDIRGRYFAMRQILAVLVSALLPLLAGYILDISYDQYTGFAILFGMAFIFMFCENYAFWNIEDTNVENYGKGNVKIYDIFRIPLKDRYFMGYTIKLVIFHLALYLSASYVQVYMIRYLKLPYTFISSMVVMDAVIQIFVYTKWGRLGDRKGHRYVMELSMWFFVLYMAAWAITSQSNMYFSIPLAYLFSAIANSGFALGSFNSRYDIMPEKGRNLYDAFYTAVIGLTLLMAPWLGGQFKGVLARSSSLANSLQFGEFRIIFAISAIGIAALQIFGTAQKHWKQKKA